ncbi:MAG TPA: hypothetical protein VF407_07975, partial [Polyangiaceae bacterium]
QGNAGGGDTAIDVSLASPGAEDNPTPPTPPSTATAQPTAVPTHEPPPVDPRETDPDGIEPKPLPPLPSLPKQQQSSTARPSEIPANGKDQTTNGGRRPGAPGAGIDGSSIAGQRALLPKAMSCDDPVAGKWEALKFKPDTMDWVRFILTVKRDGTSVHGNILSRTWTGTPFDSVPPPCFPGALDLTVSMPASGTTNGETIKFGASRYSVVAQMCSPLATVDYFPDNFSGTIDPARQEFQSKNNDGAVDFDVPYVFRRIACE